jgi:hypothetical protein
VDLNGADVEGGAVSAVLEGGPSDLPGAMRTVHVPPDQEKIKVLHRCGYEHFERGNAAPSAERPVVFQWTMRTRVAE